MSAPSNYSRRFFAEFIATRITAWRMQGGRSASSSRSLAGTGHPAVASHQDPHAAAEPGRDGRRLRVPGLSDRRLSPDPGIR